MPERKVKDGEQQAAQPEAAHPVASARDAQSGQASGKRTHHPVSFARDFGPAAPAPAGQAAPTASEQAFDHSEMGEMQQLQLQQQMDRKTKEESTISNVMHEQSDTADSITQNIK